MDEPLRGRSAVVTGGGSGIGRATAAALAQAGMHVMIVGRSPERLVDAARENGPRVEAVAADVTDEDDVARVFGLALERYGGVDLLVNSAGAFNGTVVDELPLEEFQRVLTVNVTGAFLCAREAFRVMRPRGRGRIINVGSIAAHRTRSNSVAYATSKHAVVGLTESLALDGRDDGIVVSCVHPGNTDVERRRAGPETGRAEGSEPMMPVEVVASLIVAAASVPDEVNVLETVVLPVRQSYLGRG